MSEAIDHELRKRIETAASLVPDEYGKHLYQVMAQRKLLARMILRGNYSDNNAEYAIEQFEQCNKLIKEIIGL